MQKKLNIKKGDLVKVITGAASGSDTNQGKVLSVDREKARAIVEGINMVSKHTKPNAQYPEGGIIKKEASIHVSNLMLIDPKTGEPTKVGRRLNKDGKLERYAKKSGETIS